MRRAWLLLVPGLLAAAPAHAARLDYRGRVLSVRAVESLARPALRTPRDPAALAALEREVAARLEPLGHLAPRIEAGYDSVADVVRLEVAEGTRFTWRAVVLRVPRADSLPYARALALAPGQPASPAALAAGLERAVADRVEHGHPYARLAVIGWDSDSQAVTVTIGGDAGPLVTVAGVRVEGLRSTRAAVAERALGALGERPFRPRAAEQGRLRLEQLGLFRSVRWEGIEAAGAADRATLLYRVEEPRYNRFEGAVGVQGDAGVAGLARLELGNLGGTGRMAALRWESRGRGLAEFGARYAEPLVLGLPLRLDGTIEQLVQDTIYTRTRWGAGARWSLSAHEGIELGWEQDRVVQEHGEVEQARLQHTRFGFERTALDQAAAPRRGTRARIAGIQTFKREVLRPPGRRRSRSSAVELDGEWHRPWGRQRVLALALRAAGRFGTERVLAPYEQWVLGGASTLRGHDEESFRADRFVLTRLESRWFVGDGGTRAFLFWDHASMATREALATGGDRLRRRHEDGVGFGLRLETAAGLIGVDYGLEPGAAPLDGKIHMQLVSTF